MDIPIFWAIFAIAIIFAGFFTAIHTNKMPITGFMLKGVATVAVIALALVGGFTGMLTRAEGIIIVIGLVFCMLGDIALALHEFGLSDPERKENIIQSGMSAFGCAQIAFSVAMFMLIGHSALGILMPMVFGIVVALCVWLLAKPLKLEYGKCKGPAIAYAFFLAMSVGASFALCIVSGWAVYAILLFAGFLSFFASDLVLSNVYFRQPENRKLYYVVYALYYAAIILIASSLYFF